MWMICLLCSMEKIWILKTISLRSGIRMRWLIKRIVLRDVVFCMQEKSVHLHLSYILLLLYLHNNIHPSTKSIATTN